MFTSGANTAPQRGQNWFMRLLGYPGVTGVSGRNPNLPRWRRPGCSRDLPWRAFSPWSSPSAAAQAGLSRLSDNSFFSTSDGPLDPREIPAIPPRSRRRDAAGWRSPGSPRPSMARSTASPARSASGSSSARPGRWWRHSRPPRPPPLFRSPDRRRPDAGGHRGLVHLVVGAAAVPGTPRLRRPAVDRGGAGRAARPAGAGRRACLDLAVGQCPRHLHPRLRLPRATFAGRWLEARHMAGTGPRPGNGTGAGSVLVNPYGPALLLFPLELLGRGEILRQVTEWRSPTCTRCRGSCWPSGSPSPCRRCELFAREAASRSASAAPARPSRTAAFACARSAVGPHPTATAPACQTASARSRSPAAWAWAHRAITSASSETATRSPRTASRSQAHRVEAVAGEQRQVGIPVGIDDRRCPVVQLIALVDRGDRELEVRRAPVVARGPRPRRPAGGGRRAPARTASASRPPSSELRSDPVESSHAISANAAYAHSSVRSTCSGVWASDGNHASNCEGGG